MASSSSMKNSNAWKGIRDKVTPAIKKVKRTASFMWNCGAVSNEFDPFQVFVVEHEACWDLEITIHNGENITKGSAFKDIIDEPDPYIILKVPKSSNCSKRTTQYDNDTNPRWNETFHFYLDPNLQHQLEVTLMDANYTLDETLGHETFIVNNLIIGQENCHTFSFLGGSKVHTTLLLTNNEKPDLRFSLTLCDEEKNFLKIRREKVQIAMKKLLGEAAPESDKLVPIMAVLGSGGGFRAMTCMSGAIKALDESGILDCATYISGLSGSSWYISTLYAHDSFSKITHEQMHSQLRDSVTSGWKYKLFNSPYYFGEMMRKYTRGQPISFTDYFGHLLGDVLLKDVKHKKLSDQQAILRTGTVPFPLYTCLHAKRTVSCRRFSEWVEFTPFEIGIAKYGTFIKTEHFGSKFIVGKLVKQFTEFPLHYLQGVWGSAFTILIRRLVQRGGSPPKDMVQMMRENLDEREMNRQLEDDGLEESDNSDTDDENNIVGNFDNTSSEDETPITKSNKTIEKKRKNSLFSTNVPEKNNLQDCTDIFENCIIEETVPQSNLESVPTCSIEKLFRRKMSITTPPLTKSTSCDATSITNRRLSLHEKRNAFSFDVLQVPPKQTSCKISTASDPGISELNHSMSPKLSRKPIKRQDNIKKGLNEKKWRERKHTVRKKREEKKVGGIISSVKETLMEQSSFLNSRAGRAGEILNPFRGLTVRESFPISPFAPYDDEVDHPDDPEGFGPECRNEPLDNTAKKLFVVDSGLAFNSPFPLLLRPQRAVDIYLSFDFSQRPHDADKPFKELLLAETWALQNKVPFPPIEKQIKQYEDEDEIREVYIFKNPDNPACPVILHFPIVNNLFREFKAPNVPRTTQDEFDFANFDIFDDPTQPYSSTNFVFETFQFERLVKMVEFNTLSCIDKIKEELVAIIKKKHSLKKDGTFRDVVDLVKKATDFTRSFPHNNSIKLKIHKDKDQMLHEYATTQQLLETIEACHSASNSDADYKSANEEDDDEDTYF